MRNHLYRVIKLAITVFALIGIDVSSAATRPITEAQRAQRDKMSRCHQQATDLALGGDDRRAFMGDCLRKHKKRPRDEASNSFEDRPATT